MTKLCFYINKFSNEKASARLLLEHYLYFPNQMLIKTDFKLIQLSLLLNGISVFIDICNNYIILHYWGLWLFALESLNSRLCMWVVVWWNVRNGSIPFQGCLVAIAFLSINSETKYAQCKLLWILVYLLLCVLNNNYYI